MSDDGSLSPSSKDSAVDVFDLHMPEEIEYLVNHRAALLVQESYNKDRQDFEQILTTFASGSCSHSNDATFLKRLDELKTTIEQEQENRKHDEIERLNKKLELISAENSHLHHKVEDLRMKEVVLKGLIPQQDLLNRYRTSWEELIQKNNALEAKLSKMQLANQQLITAYNQSESRFRNIQEDLNEESRKREFAERRSNELYKLLQRAEVGIGIDNRPKP